MNKCLYCYAALEANDPTDYHAKCIKAFYGTNNAPSLPYQLSEMEKLAKEVVELSVTVTGVQPKLSLGWIKNTLEEGSNGLLTIMDALEGLYILKPQNIQFEQMPENEHLSMKLAELFKINVVPSNMIRLRSGELCYITKRIDRKKDNIYQNMPQVALHGMDEGLTLKLCVGLLESAIVEAFETSGTPATEVQPYKVPVVHV